MAKKYLLDFAGETISVNDVQIIAASKTLSSNTGIFAEPAAATAFAGFLNYYKNNKLKMIIITEDSRTSYNFTMDCTGFSKALKYFK